MTAAESAVRRMAKSAGYLLRRNRVRDTSDPMYGLYTIVHDTPANRNKGAADAFRRGAGTSLALIVDLLQRMALHDEALFQGLQLGDPGDGSWLLYPQGGSPGGGRHFADMDSVRDYLTEDEHCVRCHAEHPEECHTGSCPWSLVHDYLVCPGCLTVEELSLRVKR